MEYLFLLIGIAALVVGGECLVRSAVGLNMKFKLSPLLIGTTVVSFGTSAPELIVSINAVLDGNSQIAVGNVIGSNVANIGLVLGITILLRSLIISRSKYMWSWSLMLLASLMFFLFSMDYVISAFEGLILLLGLFVFIYQFVKGTHIRWQLKTICGSHDLYILCLYFLNIFTLPRLFGC